tara:strand:+ start:1993 stop:2232 length:240 start_codon:yes stop_codon:yes gene_type:complete
LSHLITKLRNLAEFCANTKFNIFKAFDLSLVAYPWPFYFLGFIVRLYYSAGLQVGNPFFAFAFSKYPFAFFRKLFFSFV